MPINARCQVSVGRWLAHRGVSLMSCRQSDTGVKLLASTSLMGGQGGRGSAVTRRRIKLTPTCGCLTPTGTPPKLDFQISRKKEPLSGNASSVSSARSTAKRPSNLMWLQRHFPAMTAGTG